MEAYLKISPFLPTYGHLLFASLLPIYAGAHASLRRPLNTLSPAELKALRPSDADEDEDDDELALEEKDDHDHDSASPIEKLTTQDAMMFPVTAGVMLGGLYMIIKYLDDPTLLSRILTWYFCFVGVFAVGKAYSDSMGVAVSYIFPARFRDATGLLYSTSFDSWKATDSGGVVCTRLSPLLFFDPPAALHKALWSLRRDLRARWVLCVSTSSSKKPFLKPFWMGDIVGPVVGAIVVAAYAAGGKHWLLTNIMGISFSYGAMQLISPTTFPIATLLLGLLFFYDIFFVFYTPLMVTVATSLDVPIKLLFPRPGTTSTGAPALAMLGLGDIVLPGLIIAMALRWDLWRHYEIQRRSLLKAACADPAKPLDAKARKSLKPRYTKATSMWGEAYWASGATQTFTKTYFHASLVGYVVGMLCTLGIMHVFKHAQPALLYLVPGVLISVWGTAAVKGEIKVMWGYSEEGQDEEEEEKGGEDTKKAEKEEKEEEEEEAEVEKMMLDVKIIRRPAIGAKKLPAKKPVTVEEPKPEPDAKHSEETDDEVAEAEDTESETSSEVIVDKEEDAAASPGTGEEEGEEGEPRKRKMWDTTIIGSEG